VVDPLFWLGLSILLVAVSLAAVLIAALPALQELARAARSAEKLFDTLSRELPPTLEAIRLTGSEITNLTDDVSQNVQAAGRVVEQVDQSIGSMKQQARQAQVTTRSVVAGFKAAWQVLTRPSPRPASPRSRSRPLQKPDSHRLTGPPSAVNWVNHPDRSAANSLEANFVDSNSPEDQPLAAYSKYSNHSAEPDSAVGHPAEENGLESTAESVEAYPGWEERHLRE
jgi:uncharacterized protein YoxC